MSQNFEFTAAHNEKFLALYKWLRIFAIAFILASLFVTANGIIVIIQTQGMANLSVVLIGILRIIFGVLLLRPLDNIKKIVETEENDIAELMITFKDFSQAFYFGIIIIIVQMIATGGRTIIMIVNSR